MAPASAHEPSVAPENEYTTPDCSLTVSPLPVTPMRIVRCCVRAIDRPHPAMPTTPPIMTTNRNAVPMATRTASGSVRRRSSATRNSTVNNPVATMNAIARQAR